MSPQTPQVLYTAVRTTSPDTPASTFSSPRYLSASPIPKRLRTIRPSQVLLLLSLGALITLPFLFTHHSSSSLIPSFLSFRTADSSTQHIPAATGGLPDHLSIPITLEARLSHLLSRPALEQWEAELGSRHSCPFYTYSRNTYFFHDGKPEQWERIGSTDVRRYRSKMVDYLRGVERAGGKLVWEPSMEAHVSLQDRRGLIFTGDEGKTLERMKLSLHMLRNVLHSTLPVEMYHFPDEMRDEAVRKELIETYDVRLKMVEGKRPDGKSWNIKNAAFLATNFTEFIYMDSDNIPLSDPADLFEGIEYQQSGSVFWADLNKDHPDNAIFRVLGRTCTDAHWPAEAGQLIFDKRGNNGLNLAVLHLSNHMMANPDMYGDLSYGDKDTFRFSFYALGLPYQQAPKMFASAGGYQTQGGESSSDFCGHSMLQWGLTPPSARHDPTYHPSPAFLHGILAKHRWDLQPDKLWSHIRRPRLDGSQEPLLVRTPYEFTGDCFALTLKGPDGLPDAENSMMDGQGVIMESMRDVLGGGAVWDALRTLSDTFVRINHNE